MALSDRDCRHGRQIGKCVDCDLDYMEMAADAEARRVDELTALRKQDTELIRQMLEYIEQNTCQHEETHRGGAIWEICDGCNAQWADDRGGKPKFAWAPIVLAARARLEGKP